jgi:murein L,D-transpeptidase YafK
MRGAIGLLGLASSLTALAVPSSSRSRAAITRVQPQLETDLEAMGLEFGDPVFIRIFKEESELEIWVQGAERFELFRTWPICDWSGALGPKLVEGDGQSPEGFYYVQSSRMNPSSTFHLSFNLGYPNSFDRSYERTGSYLMVHGNCVSIGCYAMTDAGIEQIWALADAALRGGQSYFRVHVFPFRMTSENLEGHQDSDWHAFWLNLKQGYDLFESTGWPPDTTVSNQSYIFTSGAP